jgi:hypothetical protein
VFNIVRKYCYNFFLIVVVDLFLSQNKEKSQMGLTKLKS